MLSINDIARAIVFSLCLLLVACGGKPAKEETGLVKPVVRDFDFSAASKKPIKAEAFGPNPYLQAVEPVPDEAKTEYRFAVEALRGGNQDLAEQQLLEMVERYPKLSGPAYNLAVLKKQQGDLDAANKYLDMALNRNYANFDARNLKALMLREAGEFDKAEQMYLDIIRSWGGYADAYRNLGILYDLYMGRVDEALVYYRQYNYMIDEPDPKVTGWIVDIERRYDIPHMDLEAIKQADNQPTQQGINAGEQPGADAPAAEDGSETQQAADTAAAAESETEQDAGGGEQGAEEVQQETGAPAEPEASGEPES